METGSAATSGRAYATSLLVSAYAAGPGRLREALTGLSLEELRARPVPGKWSALEIAFHLIDDEIVGASRLKFAYAQPGLPLVPFHQSIWAVAFGYQDRTMPELDRGLLLFENLRTEGLALFTRVTPDAWERCGGVHGERGWESLRDLLEQYTVHGERHIAQIVTLRRSMARSIALSPLLGLAGQ